MTTNSSFIVLMLSGKGDSRADFVSAHTFTSVEERDKFIKTNNVDGKYWTRCVPVGTEETIETSKIVINTGTQITIEIEDLQKAGWSWSLEEEIFLEMDANGNEVPITEEYLVISKGPYEFSSHLPDCFFADCNSWGSNIHKFREAGLLDISHILG